ncbi:hypothetical protein FA15DRAFT_759167 [Coprinopsis marcescibilis]|uniref:Uncharacterized protein n=1 Tax=Coprinopsis marcescibilis TaxID=230819 RepID=A0A5C3KL96_COPMA|nr:hypothetical protein FA15DRAFT_759167 [Coprinopsis marcescibilis]
MRVSIGSLISTAVTLWAHSASAVDLKFYYANCAGLFGACQNIPAGQCCTASTAPGASVQSTGSDVYYTFTWPHASCSIGGSQSRSGGEGCIRPNWAAYAALWETQLLNRDEASITDKKECTEVDSFGFTDSKTGQDRLFPIPPTQRAQIMAALYRGDHEALRMTAGIFAEEEAY